NSRLPLRLIALARSVPAPAPIEPDPPADLVLRRSRGDGEWARWLQLAGSPAGSPRSPRSLLRGLAGRPTAPGPVGRGDPSPIIPSPESIAYGDDGLGASGSRNSGSPAVGDLRGCSVTSRTENTGGACSRPRDSANSSVAQRCLHGSPWGWKYG